MAGAISASTSRPTASTMTRSRRSPRSSPAAARPSRGGIADAISLKLAAGTLVAEDTTFSNVSVDGSYANGVLNVKKLVIRDVAGAYVSADGQIARSDDAAKRSSVREPEGRGAWRCRRSRLAPLSGNRLCDTGFPTLRPISARAISISRRGAGRRPDHHTPISSSTAILPARRSISALGWTGREADWREGIVKASARITQRRQQPGPAAARLCRAGRTDGR